MKAFIMKALKIIGVVLLLISFLAFILYKCTNFLVSDKIDSSTVYFLNGKWIEVPVQINGSDAYGLFDTGASICAIDKSAISKFDVYKIPLKLIPINNHTWHSLCIIKHLEIGDVVFKNVLAVVLDLKTNNKSLRCAQSDMIIGTPIINQLCWDFNFGSKKLFVSKSNSFVREREFNNSILYSGKNLLKTDVRINGHIHNLLIDFGYTSSIMLPLNFADSSLGAKYVSSEKQDIFGNYYEEGVRGISDIVFGIDTVKNVRIEYNDIITSILGLGFIKRYSGVIIDPFEKRLYFEEGKKNNLGTRFYGFGLNFGIQNNSLMVTSVSESSPAQKAGVKHGDSIFQICNEKLSDYLLATDYCNFLQMRDSLLSQETLQIKIVRKDTISISLNKDFF